MTEELQLMCEFDEEFQTEMTRRLADLYEQLVQLHMENCDKLDALNASSNSRFRMLTAQIERLETN
jgi:hypothetical protein|tara:strand:- start:8750 stop:8947 length:198 start_codon:yes stop_codon:yes gene_type:complete